MVFMYIFIDQIKYSFPVLRKKLIVLRTVIYYKSSGKGAPWFELASAGKPYLSGNILYVGSLPLCHVRKTAALYENVWFSQQMTFSPHPKARQVS